MVHPKKWNSWQFEDLMRWKIHKWNLYTMQCMLIYIQRYREVVSYLRCIYWTDSFSTSTIVIFIKHNIMLYKNVFSIYKLESRGDSVSHRPLSMYNITTLLLNQSSIECVLTFVYSNVKCWYYKYYNAKKWIVLNSLTVYKYLMVLQTMDILKCT